MKKAISVFLALTLLMGVSFANALGEDIVTLPKVGTVSGTLTAVHDWYDKDGNVVSDIVRVSVTDSQDAVINFVINSDTYFITGTGLADLKEGDRFTGFYDATLPVIMIYPPQYTAIAVAVNPPVDMYMIKVDVFDVALTSSDNALALIPSPTDTTITDTNGNAYTGTLVDKRLAVVYHTVTGTVPLQTTPSKIILLDASETVPEMLLLEADFVVNDTNLGTQGYYLKNGTTVMVPFRAVAEALGYTVSYQGRQVMMGPHNVFNFDEDAYTFARKAPIALGAQPYLLEGVTYVPLTYFRVVLGLNNAYLLEGQIVLNNEEAME